MDKITGERPWTLICVEKLGGKFYGDDDLQRNFSRQRILSHLAEFLGWPNDQCTDCFDKWKNSRKNHVEMLGEENVAMLLQHMRSLGGIWPPQLDNPLEEQKCTL